MPDSQPGPGTPEPPPDVEVAEVIAGELVLHGGIRPTEAMQLAGLQVAVLRRIGVLAATVAAVSAQGADTPADELAGAERWARKRIESEFQPPGPGLDRLRTLLAEYDRRGAEIDHLRGEALRLVDGLGLEAGMRVAAVDELETLRRRLWALVGGDQMSDDDTVGRLGAQLEDQQARRGPEQCCDQACNGGACETSRCCCAGWCVMGTDGLPEDPDDLAGWIEAAREHNPIVEAWAVARAQRDAALALHRPKAHKSDQGATRTIVLLDRPSGVDRPDPDGETR